MMKIIKAIIEYVLLSKSFTKKSDLGGRLEEAQGVGGGDVIPP